MYELADLVELRQPELEDVTTSVVFISPGADQGHRLYTLVLRYCKPKTTLQSLAIRGYLELIQGENEGAAIDERSLRRDLKRLKAWDENYERAKSEDQEVRLKFHKRNRIESVNSTLKSKYEEEVLSKSPAARYNEALCKVICHNLSVLIRCSRLLGFTPEF